MNTATIEAIGHREHVDGDAVDYLTSSRSRGGNNGPVANHGLRSQVKTINRRRSRRGVRQALRNGDYQED